MLDDIENVRGVKKKPCPVNLGNIEASYTNEEDSMTLRKQLSNRLKQKLAILLSVALVLGSFPALFAPQEVKAADTTYYVSSAGDDSNAGTTEAPFATIEKALEAVDSMGTIVLLSDITLDQQLTIGVAGKTVTISSEEGNTFSINRGAGYINGDLIRINSGTITFQNLIIDGQNVEVDSGVFGVYIPGGTVAFEHVEITNHIVKSGGRFVVIAAGPSRVFIKEGTQVKDNEVRGFLAANPPGVLGAGSGGVLVIEGGLITENTISEGSNGVIVGVGSASSPRFEMTGGTITGNNLLGNEFDVNGNTVGNVAVNMRGTSAQARFDFGGTAYVYDNLNAAGQQRNVFLKNTTAQGSAFLTLIRAMEDGAKVGVYANIMPNDQEPIVDVAIGSDGYVATVEDASYFVSDKSTDASVAYDEDNQNVVLTTIDLQLSEPADQQIVGPTPTISGTGTTGTTVQLKLSNKLDPSVVIEAEVTIQEDGTWGFIPEDKLASGDYTLEATLVKDGITTTVTRGFTVVDKEALQAKVDEVNGQNLAEEDYTPESWQVLQEAFQAAQAVLDNANASQAGVDEALTNLEAAYTALTKWVPQLESVVLEKSTGQQQIILTFDQEVQLTSGDVTTGFSVTLGGIEINVENVTVDTDDPTKVTLVLSAEPDLADVEQVAVSYNHTDENVKGTNDTVVESFTISAENPFATALKITDPSTGTVNTSRPEIAGEVEAGSTVTVTIKDAEGNVVTEAGGTAIVDDNGSWGFTPSVDLPDGSYTIEATATKDGKTATKTKELTIGTIDKTALQEKVDEITGTIDDGSLQEEDYTPESWAALEEALQAAQAVLNDPDATQEDVDAAHEALTQARQNIIPVPPLLERAAVNEANKLELTFDHPIELEDLDGFTITVNGQPVVPSSFTVDGNILILTLPNNVAAADTVAVSYNKENGNLRGTNGGPAASFNTGATNNLEVKVDKSALQAKVAEINDAIGNGSLQEENYTPESWAALEEALQAAQAVLNDPDATQEDVDAAHEALTQARQRLASYPDIIPAPVSPLLESAAVNEANKLQLTFDHPIELDNLDGFTITVNGQPVVPSSFTVDGNILIFTLPNNVAAADTVAVSYNKENGNLRGTNGGPAASFNKGATNNLEVEVDKSALQAKVAEINVAIGNGSLQEENYTPESWTALEEALQAAHAVLNDPDATQAEVDEALAALQAARSGLQPVEADAPSSGLQSIIPSAGTLQPNFAADVIDYTMTVGNNTSQIQFTLTSGNPDAAITINGTSVTSGQASGLFNLSVGENKFTVAVTEQDGTTKNYTITVTRQGSSGGVFFPSNPVQRITVNVEAGGQGVVAQTEIERTSNSDGTKSDKVTFVPEKAIEAVEKTREAGATAVRIVIPDTQDEVRDVRVDLPQAALKAVQEAGLDLEIFTDNGMITIPNASLADMNPNLYFYLVPIKKESERKEVEERAKKEKQVQEILNDGTVYVVDRPMTIETNMTSRQVKITLPMDRSHLPSDAAEREAFLADLVIFIEHSDGERKLVKPEIGQYSNSKLGLTFTVEKFSTFTILNMSNWGTYLQAQEELAGMPEGAEGLHHAYINGYPDGTFKPSRTLTRAEMAAILSRVLEQEPAGAQFAYPDVAATHWAQQAISRVSQTGLMEGYPDGKFRPEKAISRSEMAAIVGRWMKLEGATKHSFSDVDGHWAEQLIASVSQAGYMEGYPDGSFDPDKAVTRAEAVVIVNRVLARGPLYNMTEPTWSDVPMSHWAFHHIEEASHDHYYNFRPEGGETIVE
ncbi:S-layer homology domain-containing protein [Paenibacillus tarimensis]